MRICFLYIKGFIIFFVFFLLGCKPEEHENIHNSRLINELNGTWESVEVYATDGASQPTWTPMIDNLRFYYSFTSDSKVLSNHNKDGCNQGSIRISSDSLITFNFPCITFENRIDSLTSDTLILDTQNFEPLKYKFTKALTK